MSQWIEPLDDQAGTLTFVGMGNRFFTMTGYHSLIEAHAIVAAITFLGVIPAAIMLARFYRRSSFWALRLHVWLQITTLLLVIVIFVSGWFAVGPHRSLSNPHHGIGLALFLLIIFQVLGGAFIYRRQDGRSRNHLSLKRYLHQWLGRAISLLGIAQVALGLTLYGSPAYLFVLYTLFVFSLLVLYFVLSWLAQRRINDDGGNGSYISGREVVQERRDEHRGPGWGRLAAAGATGAGLAALFRRRSSKAASRVNAADTDVSGSSYISDEKYSETSNRGWRDRLLHVGAITGGLGPARSWFKRKDRNDDPSNTGPYRPPMGVNQASESDSASRIEEGRMPLNRPVTPPGNSPGYVRPTHPLANPPITPRTPARHNSTSQYSYYSYMSGSPSRRDRRGKDLRNPVAAAGGGLLAFRQLFRSRRQRKEERRAEELRQQRIEEERIARMNSQRRHAGDRVTPPRRVGDGPTESQVSTNFTGSIVDDRDRRPGMNPAIPTAGVGAAAAGALADRDNIRPAGMDPPVTVGAYSYAPGDLPLHLSIALKSILLAVRYTPLVQVVSTADTGCKMRQPQALLGLA